MVIVKVVYLATDQFVQGSIRDGEGLERAYNCVHAGMRRGALRRFHLNAKISLPNTAIRAMRWGENPISPLAQVGLGGKPIP